VQWETDRSTLIIQHESEKDELANQLATEKERFLNEIAGLQRERDEQLFMAEADKQEVRVLWQTTIHDN